MFMGGHVNCSVIMINGFLARKLVPASTGCREGRCTEKAAGNGGGYNTHSLLCTFALTVSLTVFYTTRSTLPVLRAMYKRLVVWAKRKLFASIQPFLYDRWNSNQGSGYVSPNYTDNVIQVVVAACGIKRRRWITCPAEWISVRNHPFGECISRKHKLRVLRRICGPKVEDASGVRGNRRMRSFIILITE